MNNAYSVQRFRSTHRIPVHQNDAVNWSGIENLNISGSNRPAFEDLKKKLSHVKGKIYIIDLTGGEHPYYKGTYPLEFLGCTSKEKRHFINKLRRFLVSGGQKLKDEDFVSEEELARQHGFEYIKLQNERGWTPRGKMIDQIIQIVEAMGPDDWLHFHCIAGRGRTSVAMVIVDILKNGRTVPLDHIVRRWHLMGGENLFDTEVWANGSYTMEKLTRRKKRIIDFYHYVNDPNGYGQRSWVEWCHYTNNEAINDG